MGDVSSNSRESERPAQSHDLAPVPSSPPAAGPPAVGWGSRTLGSTSRSRVWTARLVALAADVLQIALLPLVLGGAISPVNDMIDVVTAVVLTVLVGWHWAFLPAFVAEIVPFVDLVPSWTLAVFIATRGRGPDLTRT